MERYEPAIIEAKWQARWLKDKTFAVLDTAKGERTYVLDMFPYPSAQGLHVGHPEGYTATDIYCRYLRAQGKAVLHPMGWDAFGLPAENYAIKTGRHPKEVTQENIDNFRRQIQSLGFSYDWSREVNTSDPSYYKWTQWIFLQLYKKGLAYCKAAPVNWCPQDQTVLANEQVVDGKCERCHNPVEQRNMQQWFFKITDYAEKLLQGLEGLDWPQPIIDMQKNWIGKSEGAEVEFSIKDQESKIKIFTTRLDTIFGATFIAISPELAKKWIDGGWQATAEVKKYVVKSLQGRELERMERAAKEKTGFDTGVKAINPATKEEMPVWVADYVLGSYGTGAIMAVPAHDERDFEFAKKFNLPIKEVVVKQIGARRSDAVRRDGVAAVLVNHGKCLILYDKTTGEYRLPAGGYEANEKDVEVLEREIKEETGYSRIKIGDYLGQIEANYYAIDKKVQRYRYQKGYLVYLADETMIPLSRKDESNFDYFWLSYDEALKKLLSNKSNYGEHEFVRRVVDSKERCFVGLGTVVNSGDFSEMNSEQAKFKIAQKIGAKLTMQYRLRDWLISRQRYWGAPIPIIYCEKCGEVPVPEKDLPVELPDDVDFRPTGESPLARSKTFHNVKCPKCKAPARRENDTMDTFVDSSWYFLRYCDPNNTKVAFDPAKVKHWCPVNTYVGGAEHAVMHLLYARFITKVLADLDFVKFEEPFLKLRNQGLILGADGQKMSKSRGNVVNPDEVVKEWGADSMRLFEMFLGPLEDVKPWNPRGLVGLRRFLERVWKLQAKVVHKAQTPDESGILSHLVSKVTSDIEQFRFNTAIAALMVASSELEGQEAVSQSSFETFVIVLAPFAPHMAEELWEQLGHATSVSKAEWPVATKSEQQEEFAIVVQVNGRTRAQLKVSSVDESLVVGAARQLPNVSKYLVDKKLLRTVYVSGRLVNFVVAE